METAVFISESLFGSQPVGKWLYILWDHPDDTYEIVGVVGDVHQRAMDIDIRPGVFLSTLQEPTSPVNLVVRTHGDPGKLAGTIVAEIHALDRYIPVSEVRTMDEYIADSVAAPRFNTILLGSFATLALALAAVGIFGVVSYSVAQRTREMGIRRALGAESGNVMFLVLVQGLRLTVVGVALGLMGAYFTTRLMETLLFNVAPTDPYTIICVAVTLIVVAFLACYFPARRAAKVDPITALRYE